MNNITLIMKNKILKYSLITIGCIVILLAITNPSPKQFKDYLGLTNPVRRTSNWIIFSNYEYTVTSRDKYGIFISGETKYYFAIFNNFYEILPECIPCK